jgi:predicted metal-binding membrane protein
MTSTWRAATAAASPLLVLASAAWIVSIRQMSGMEMGVGTELGSFPSFVLLWVAMMAAMMLPGAIPAVLRAVRAAGSVRAVPMFIGSYLAVWTLVGATVFLVYRPHGTVVAGVVTIAVGVYELTPLKRHFRQRCFASAGSGFTFGLDCVGSCIGLMVLLVALDFMSIAWMSAITVVVLAQKLVPARAVIDRPLALAMVGLGVLIVVEPSAIPGLTPMK